MAARRVGFSYWEGWAIFVQVGLFFYLLGYSYFAGLILLEMIVFIVVGLNLGIVGCWAEKAHHL